MIISDVLMTSSFKRSIKKLEKRYLSVKKDIKFAIEALLENPNLGALIPDDYGVRKLRVRNSDVRRGKSGGYRLLYFVKELRENRLCLLLLYSKSDKKISIFRNFKSSWKTRIFMPRKISGLKAEAG